MDNGEEMDKFLENYNFSKTEPGRNSDPSQAWKSKP